MPERMMCLRVRKLDGEKAIRLANRLGVSNKHLRIQRNNGFILIPMTHQLDNGDLASFRKQIPHCELAPCAAQQKRREILTLDKLVENEIPSDLRTGLPRALDIIGDIAIVEMPTDLQRYETTVGEAVLKAHKSVRVVMAKAGPVKGPFRLRTLRAIAGEERTETIHREHGCRFHVDVAKTYFSPRLSYEHKRVASLVCEGETVIDMFTGIGPFPVIIANRKEGAIIYAIDINPEAVEYLKRNIRANRVVGRVHPLLGDARSIIESSLSGVADRVIMNLPEESLKFVDSACKAIRTHGGMIHFYGPVNRIQNAEDMKSRLVHAVNRSGRTVRSVVLSRIVRNIAPHRFHVVMDTRIV